MATVDLRVSSPDRGSLDGRSAFRDRLDPVDRLELDSLGTTRILRSGQVLFLQGERGGRVAIVRSGLVKVSAADEQGRVSLLGFRRPGELIGDIEALDDLTRDATAVVVEPSSVQVVPATEFLGFLRSHPLAAVAFARVLAQQVRSGVDHRLRSAQSVAERLAVCLLRLTEQHGQRRIEDGALVIGVPLSQDDLASLVDASRDSIAKTLTTWRRLKIVETGRRHLAVVDMDRLAGYARSFDFTE